ncbi:RING finger protein nhl-1-like [Pomacea canaliculata]|uniref:RING finger protein nhl-1-like n=1 Tax=Pomacea canaliculata TaxID=400727 RepID=UPI000D72A247|nr:RING finger protein nhl-1-like [Pomacea canaliculata]XP_025094557.1 RING finger protein nhl-1-like [Pomacea canaliculata]XP_025094558.1 RING finger protein nhl-1-like [Pomacea canaliculata]XP_025094559.1 RING finger protein nhl-1-like [Pomacea canaliculata]XP_025094560.1 RING finger protein nhl-1-like [Pomacea canaliculata]
MADTEMSYSAEHIQRLLQCSVCLDRFKQPKLLPCQHTFCLSPCLEGLVDRLTRIVRCPECRADHVVPRGGPSYFPNNLTIISFLELPPLQGERNEPAPPRNVPQGAPVSSPRLAAGGILGTSRSVLGRIAFDMAGSAVGGGCNVCHSDGRIMRCGHCDLLVCEGCKRGHMDQVRGDVNRLVSQVRRQLPQITEQINMISRKETQLQARCEIVKNEISEAIERHVRELTSRERIMREDVDTFLLGELRNLRTHQENLEVELASMASFCDTTESILSRDRHLTDGDLVELKRQCVEHIEILRDYENGTLRPPLPRNIQLSSESQFLSTTIGNFGDLIITSGTGAVRALDQTRNAETSEGNSRSERRTTLRPPETATDYVLSVLNPRASSLSPAVTRRHRSPGRSTQSAVQTPARSAQILSNDDLYEEEDDVPPPPSHLRRRPRREHHSDTRIAGLMNGDGEHSLSQLQQSRARHLSLGALPPSSETSEQTESSVERESPERIAPARQRSAAAQNSDNMVPVGIGMAPSLTYPPRHSVRQPLRFDISLNSLEPDSADEHSSGSEAGLHTFMRSTNSPSIYVTTPRNKYNQKGQAMIRFGERGNAERQFTWPRGVAVSPLDDNVYVADSSNHRVQIFDNTGCYIRSFGRYGQGEGEFDCLAGITVNGLGQVIIADRYNHRIQIFDRNGSFQSAFGSEGINDGQLNYPWGIACDNMGFIYVCDKENHRVQVFQSNGSFVRKFGRLGNGTGHFDNPHYVAVSPDNKVYVSDSSNHRIQVFSIYGDFLFSFGTSGTLRGQMKFPRGIAIDNQGFVVVADSGNNRVQIFRADGRYYSMFGGWGSENGQFKGLEGIAILANGNVVVSDRENHRIQIF